MDKLYYDDQYIKEFTAELIEANEKDNKFHVVLDKTAFFPGGGGQPCDLGTIEGAGVLDVYEENGIVYHVMDKKPMKLHRLKCKLDWERRKDGMDQHLGQHVLSGCFFHTFNANTLGIHIGKDFSTVDIEGILNEKQIREGEALANKVVSDNLLVEFLLPDKRELKKINLRRALPKTNEDIRVVKIDDFDINACCGIHPSHTIELRMIKIIKFEKYKGNTRIEYLVGNRAVQDSLKKDEFANVICKHLNCNESDAINGISNLNDRLVEVTNKNKKLTERIAKFEIKEIIDNGYKHNNITIIKKIYENDDIKYISKVINKITEYNNMVIIAAVTNENRVNLIFAASKNIKGISMNALLKDAITLIDGKGGGSDYLAQGAGKNNNNLNSALDYTLNKVKQSF